MSTELPTKPGTGKEPPRIKFSPTQGKIMKLLEDKQRHTRKEIHAAAGFDSHDPLVYITPHLTQIRKLLRLTGRDIICEMLGGGIFYRLGNQEDLYNPK